MKKHTESFLTELLGKHLELSLAQDSIISAFKHMSETYQNNGKLLICGNGGSAADADHIVGELMKGFVNRRKLNISDAKIINRLNPAGNLSNLMQMALPAINLSAHTALISAISNDMSPDMIFAQQVFGYGNKGDTLLGISTSGNSTNVINAGIIAKAMKIHTIGLTGMDGGQMNGLFDIIIKVPKTATADIQELHLPIYHTLCAMLEEEFFGEDHGACV